MRPAPAAILATLILAPAAPALQTPLRVWEGDGPQQWLVVARAVGDLNGDGVGDLALGAPGDLDAGGVLGRVHLVSGSDGSLLQTIVEPSGQLGSGFGLSIAPAGDIDGDTVPDLLVGAALYDGAAGVDCGRVTAHSGSTGAVLYALEGSGAGDAFSAGLDGDGRIDIDPAVDFVVSAPLHDGPAGPDSGRVYVFTGNGPTLERVHDGLNAGDEFGDALAFAGFVDDDDLTDVVVGSYQEISLGSARVYSGDMGALLYQLFGAQVGGDFGCCVAGAGDVNGDGRDDFLVGAESHVNPSGVASGCAWVYSGLTGAELHEWCGVGAGDLFGFPVAGAGDLDGDGHDDVLVGALEADVQGPDAGRAQAFSGATGDVLFEMACGAPGDQFGVAAGVGDLDGDGAGEIAVGAPFDGDGGADAGSIWLFAGSDFAPAICSGDDTGAPCPCGNPGSGCEGCRNSGGTGGRLLVGGSASSSSDDLTFEATRLLPGQPGLLFAGSMAIAGGAGLPFGDGLRCVGGGVLRLGVRTPDANGSAAWGPGLVALGGWSVGETRYFQCWYRDPGGPCGQNFNLTGANQVRFVP